jgi:hypothetical protein
MDYYIWSTERNSLFCTLDRLPDGNQAMFRARIGRPMGADYPDTLPFHMSSDLGGIKVADLVRNTLGYYIVGPAIHEVLSKESGESFEFLPIDIINRKGRREDAARWIANLLGEPVVCADLSKSTMREMALKKGRYSSLQRLVIDTGRVDPSLKIFRLGEMPHLFIVRDDLRAALDASGATGMQFHAMGVPVMFD